MIDDWLMIDWWLIDDWLMIHDMALTQFWLCLVEELDGVGPVDNRPSTDKLYHFVQKKKKCDMWRVTCDTWRVTYDTWHVTCLGGWTFSQNFSSLALTVCDLWYYEDLEEKADWFSQSVNYKAVYRTAPATLGLLIIILNHTLDGGNRFSSFLQTRCSCHWSTNTFVIH